MNSDEVRELDNKLVSIFLDKFNESDYDMSWNDFINKKSLGVKAEFSLIDNSWTYKVIDEKNWAYHKIKYEF